MPRPARRARLRAALQRIYTAAIDAADPQSAITRAVRVTPRAIHVGGERIPRAPDQRTHVLAIGKAGSAMAEALVRLIPDGVAGGVVVTKHGHGRAIPALETVEAGHPVPDKDSVHGARALLRYAARHVHPGDVVLVGISGGGSAVCCAPVPGLTLGDKRRTTDLLLRAGATITEMNTVRKRLSAIKGGRLAAALGGAHVITLIVSDVMGDDPATVASGPTVPDTTTDADARRVLERYALTGRVSPRVRECLRPDRTGVRAHKSAPPVGSESRQHIHVIANNAAAVAAAARTAKQEGFRPLVLSTTIGGETRDVAEMHAAMAREVCVSGRPGRPPVALISGGETVVTLGRASGTGGRCQEFALAFLAALGPVPRPVALACVGTDGTDGPTDAAGAVGDDRTLRRAAALGLPDARSVLARHDAYPWFAALGDLIMTGPTGTNVMDVRIALIA